MRATSRPRVTWPLLSDLMITWPNCSGVSSRPSVCTLSWNASCDGIGGWFRMPADTCTFCARNAFTTSSPVMPYAAILSGSSQIRIA